MLKTMMDLLNKYGYVYLDGLMGTLVLAAITVFFATIVGTLIAMMKLSKIKAFDILVSAYIGIIRGTPILLQLYFFWLILPKVLPIQLSDTACIVIALIVNASSYVAEIIRAGIQAVAAKSLGLSNRNMMRKVILPQAIKNILPALGNEYISMVKQTSLASVFFVQELMTSYKTVQSATFISVPSLMITGLIYLIVNTVLTKALAIFEGRLRANE